MLHCFTLHAAYAVVVFFRVMSEFYLSLLNNSFACFLCFEIFMQPGFSLQNPETFNQVLPWQQIKTHRQDSSSEKSVQSSKLLQEKVFDLLFDLIYLPGFI